MSTASVPRKVAPAATRTPGWPARLDTPATTYYLIASVTAALVVFGLIMVLSASAIVSLTTTKSAYSIFLKQAAYASVGTLALIAASRVTPRGWRAAALPVFVVAVSLQLLVFTALGVAVGGNRNWLDLRVIPVQIQPSELIKLGLVLLGAQVLSTKASRLTELGHVLVPYLVPISVLALGVVLLGGDLGTALVLFAIVLGVLFTAGVPRRWFVAFGLPTVIVVATFVLTSRNRLDRFDVWLGRDTNEFGMARQPIHGRYALADGGWFGLGLGASREKWGLLSEPHNDFIFAIIGEELGLPGTLAVLALFALLAIACYRLVMRTDDLFVRLVAAGAMTWILVQAFVNIGAVINLLPVIGVPLPLVSSGGSSLITTMVALGVLLSCARAEPGCREALAARPSMVHRSRTVVAALRNRSPR